MLLLASPRSRQWRSAAPRKPSSKPHGRVAMPHYTGHPPEHSNHAGDCAWPTQCGGVQSRCLPWLGTQATRDPGSTQDCTFAPVGWQISSPRIMQHAALKAAYKRPAIEQQVHCTVRRRSTRDSMTQGGTLTCRGCLLAATHQAADCQRRGVEPGVHATTAQDARCQGSAPAAVKQPASRESTGLMPVHRQPCRGKKQVPHPSHQENHSAAQADEEAEEATPAPLARPTPPPRAHAGKEK